MNQARWTWQALALTLFLVLGSCGGEIDTPGEELRIFAQGIDRAFVDEDYSGTLRVAGGLTPYTFRIDDGSLPPGLRLEGGTIRGRPTETGRYTFTIVVSDANLSKTFREFSLRVEQAPPAELRLNVPTTEVRNPFMIRAEVQNARELQAFRTLLSWDADRFELVEGSVRATRNDLALFTEYDNGELHVDVAVLGRTLSGNQRVFELELRPRETNTIEVQARTEFLDSDGRHAFSSAREGRRPTPREEENDLDEDEFDNDSDDGFNDNDEFDNDDPENDL